MRLTFGPAALAVVFGAIVSALVVRNVLVAGRRPLGWAVGGASTWALTLILTLFALGWGPRFSAAAQRQIRDPARRDRISSVVGGAFERSQVYVDAAVLLALATGLVAWVTLTLTDLPAPTVLALVVGVASLVPSLGIVVAAAPVAVLAGGVVSPVTGVALIVGAVALQVVHRLVLNRVTAGASHPGPAVIVISFLVGFELYGVGGAIVAMAVATFAAAVLDAKAEEETESVVEAGRVADTGSALGDSTKADAARDVGPASEIRPPAPT